MSNNEINKVCTDCEVEKLERKIDGYSILLRTLSEELLEARFDSDFGLSLETTEKFSKVLETLQGIVDTTPIDPER